jgi:hypothetical protein
MSTRSSLSANSLPAKTNTDTTDVNGQRHHHHRRCCHHHYNATKQWPCPTCRHPSLPDAPGTYRASPRSLAEVEGADTARHRAARADGGHPCGTSHTGFRQPPRRAAFAGVCGRRARTEPPDRRVGVIHTKPVAHLREVRLRTFFGSAILISFFTVTGFSARAVGVGWMTPSPAAPCPPAASPGMGLARGVFWV